MKEPQDKIAIQVDGLSFTYPGQDIKVLRDLSFEVPAGSFLLVAGPGGSGKTTLLRTLKKELRPAGTCEGSIRLGGESGFVMQDPSNQIVMDLVWHELAFGLENLGLAPAVIERRIAETAHFFGIGHWIHRPVNELSGGEMQILNLASSLIMNPDILILDEPTARLDPVAVSHFLGMLRRIHSETGRTLIMSEHRMSDVLSLADRVLFLEQGEISFEGKPEVFAAYLLDGSHPFRAALPAATMAVRRTEEVLSGASSQALPLDVPAARRRLRELAPSVELVTTEAGAPLPEEPVIAARELVFRYRNDLPEVLKGASLSVAKGSIHAIVGGNGSGKSTLLHLLSGVLTPGRGSVKRGEGIRTGLLTQDTRALFSADTLLDELMELADLGRYSEKEVLDMLEQLELAGLRGRHPYDLSGGEIQKAALAKLLLLSPDLLLLDEPVKGMDSASKRQLAGWFRNLGAQGRTMVIVTHDLNFSAEAADTCSLLFDGRIVATEDVRSFFRGNSFYTTGFARVTEGILPDLVIAADLDRIRKKGHGG